MFFRNKELKRSTLCYIFFSGILCVGAFLHSRVAGLWVLVACAFFSFLFVTIERSRYKKLQKISEDLDALLLHNTPLPLEAYEEGELSMLANQVEKLTQRLTDTLNALQKDKTFLADALADISHQLRTPLTAMHLTISLLSQPEEEPGKHRELLRDFRGLLHRTQWLTEALLKLSKLDGGTLQLRQEEISLKELLEQSAAPFAIAMELQEQTLSLQCADCQVFCDPIWTSEAIGNVLKNAIEHTPQGGHITLTGRDTPIYTEIAVEDQGGGFPPEELPRIFERFYRGKNADPQSCGIGLSLSRSILAAQNGSIKAENTENGGKFILKLYKQIL